MPWRGHEEYTDLTKILTSRVRRSLIAAAVIGALALGRFAGSTAVPAAAGVMPAQTAGSGIPEGLASLARSAAEAANSRKPERLVALAGRDAGDRFGWAPDEVSHWKSDVLTVPTAQASAAPGYLVVLHDWHTCESDGDHVYKAVDTADGWRLGDEIPETATLGFRVVDHDLKVRFDVSKQAAIISDRVSLKRTTETRPAYALLRLSSDFRVSELTCEDKPVPYAQVGGVIAFVPPSGQRFRFDLKYAGKVDHKESDYILPNEATLDSYWYPQIARLPATATTTVTAPAGWTGVAIGERVREKRAADGSVTTTFRNDNPICFYTVDAGRYTVTNRSSHGRDLYVCLLSPDAKLAADCLDTLEAALDFYDSHFGAFPYRRYGVVQTKGPFGGALEAYSFATFGNGTLPDTIPHELSHTWWGGLVPCTYTRSMWNESFAEYSDGLFQRTTQAPGPRRRDAAPGQHRFIKGFDSFAMDQAHDTSDGKQSAVGYGKGALVLRLLEQELGQETMLRCMRAFYAECAKGDPVEWPQFEAAVERVAGKNLRWFFAQWIEQKGLPVLKLANVRFAAEGTGMVVTGDLVQEGAPYRLDVPLTIEYDGGKTVSATVATQNASASFRVKVPAEPERLILDPDDLIPLGPPSQPAVSPTVFDFTRRQTGRLRPHGAIRLASPAALRLLCRTTP